MKNHLVSEQKNIKKLNKLKIKLNNILFYRNFIYFCIIKIKNYATNVLSELSNSIKSKKARMRALPNRSQRFVRVAGIGVIVAGRPKICAVVRQKQRKFERNGIATESQLSYRKKYAERHYRSFKWGVRSGEWGVGSFKISKFGVLSPEPLQPQIVNSK